MVRNASAAGPGSPMLAVAFVRISYCCVVFGDPLWLSTSDLTFSTVDDVCSGFRMECCDFVLLGNATGLSTSDPVFSTDDDDGCRFVTFSSFGCVLVVAGFMRKLWGRPPEKDVFTDVVNSIDGRGTPSTRDR